MMRRYPVRSVLSERKMFSNGGMLPTSKPVESSMNQASGIMASSSPLIDAVSQEIIAPFTGSAAAGAPSMTGAMPMAQGGVARFREGGISDTREKINRINKIVALVRKGASMDEAIRIVDGEGIPDVQVDSRAGPPRKDMNFLDPSVSVDKFNAIYGEQLPEGGPPSINVNEDLLSLIPEANRASFAEELAANERAKNLNTPASSMRAAPPPTDMSFLPDFKSSAAMFDTVAQPDLPESGGSVPRNTVDPRVAERLIELGTTREIVQDPGLPESGGTPPSGLSEVDALTRQRMAELGTTMGIVQDPGLPESGATPPSTVAEAVIETAPPPTDMSFLDPTSSVEAFDELYGKGKSPTETGEISGDPSLTVDEQLELGEGPNAKAGFEIPQLMPSSISKPVFDPDREVSVDEELDALDSYFGSDNSQQIPTEELPEAQSAQDPNLNVDIGIGVDDEEKDVAVSEADAKKEEAVRKVENRLLSSASDEGRAGKAPGDDLTFDPEAPELSNRITPFDKTDMSEKEAVKTIADYKKLFMDEMPEYEGMSESEKGFALMEAGLRVAAGESANAITNVAKGLKGLGATFAKDEKEKRAWNRQVELSATKYGLQRVTQDTAELKADAKAERKLDPRIWKLNEGETYKDLKPGESMIPTVAQLRNPSFLRKFTESSEIIKSMELKQKKVKAGLELLEKSVTDPSKFLPASKEYAKLSSRVMTNTGTKELLNEALMLINLPDQATTGVRGLWRDFANRLGNATGQAEFMGDWVGKSLKDKAKFKDVALRATTKHIEGLIMEGGKITNQERELANEISGALNKSLISGLFEDPTISSKRLKSLGNSLDQDTKNRVAAMDGIENDWINRYSDIEKARADFSAGQRTRSYGVGLIKRREKVSLPSQTIKVPSTGFKISDITTVDKDGKLRLIKGWNK